MRVVINGGGPVGSLAAAVLLRYYDEVVVVEKRRDLRLGDVERGRSINLVLTSRGLYALEQAGMREQALALTTPVEGRLIHPVDSTGPPPFQPYGLNPTEVNYSVSRNALNTMLMQNAEARGVRYIFNADLVSICFETMRAIYRDKVSRAAFALTADLFIGADGVASVTRRSMFEQLRKDGVAEVSEVVERIGVSYMEVPFPAARGADGAPRYAMDPRGLHIWPRGTHFLMALADPGSTFTGTLYLPDGSAPLPVQEDAAAAVPRFEDLAGNPAAIRSYVDAYYPDLPALVPDYVEQMQNRTHAFLATIRCSHWHYRDRVVILGDAAHAITPFFGQGLNLGFESVMLLEQFLGAHYDAGDARAARSPANADATSQPLLYSASLEEAFHLFEAYHHPSADAIGDLAVENFVEMSSKVGQPAFRHRKHVENYVESLFPDRFRSRYFLVTETLIPYAVAQQAGHRIEACVSELVALCETQRTTIEALGRAVIEAAIATHFTPFVQAHRLVIGDRHTVYYPHVSRKPPPE